MVSLAFVFWMYVVLFAIIGGMRGWAKEILVSFQRHPGAYFHHPAFKLRSFYPGRTCTKDSNPALFLAAYHHPGLAGLLWLPDPQHLTFRSQDDP